MVYLKLRFRLVLCLFSLTIPTAYSLSQTATKSEEDTLKSYQIDEIIVSGTRTPTKIIDIPYSVERISAADYKFDKKVGVDDALEGIPGLFLQSRYGNHDVRISIRGFGSRSNSGIRGVRILQDGIPESEPDGQTRIESIDFQNVGTIEVVKGNASSLYTNAPGGVINFISDLGFPRTFGYLFRQDGSYGLSQTGFKAGFRSENTKALVTYNYHSAKGFRTHSEDYWHILNQAFETVLSEHATLSMFNYYVSGLIRLPGSITKAEFEKDPFQTNQRDVERDAKRISKKGRVGLRLNLAFDDERTNELEVTGYGTIKYFERAAGTYRIFNRHGIGASARFLNRLTIAGHANQFSAGGDVFFQTGPIEEYKNLNGRKTDDLDLLTDETITNAGFFLQNSFSIINDRMSLLLTGRFDKVGFRADNQLFGVKSSERKFEKFTPKAAINFKLSPTIAVYSSYGLGFDTPAGNELDNHDLSTNTTPLFNPDLRPQKSKNFELGVKGSYRIEDSDIFSKLFFEATFFNTKIEDEIVPFEVFGNVFFRNAAQTNRTGLELGADAELTYGLRLKTSYTLSDFTYDDYIATSYDQDTLGNIVARDNKFAGNFVPSVPKHNLSVSLSYTRVLSNDITGFAKLHYMTISGMYVDDANSDKTGGYQLLNANVGLDFTYDILNVLFSAGVNNITDKRYVGFVNINSTAQQFYEMGEPRSYFVGVNVGITPH